MHEAHLGFKYFGGPLHLLYFNVPFLVILQSSEEVFNSKTFGELSNRLWPPIPGVICHFLQAPSPLCFHLFVLLFPL
ncbi:hypothetical protein L596_007831 [Steinernema carpocapsae]|uniref:Uncharacterized protein n=1 Tax=Steinernema carpocapsae TaxID=34508 RepID=A0A4U5PAN5_STECR|nr:hypothetical protein L596_007831 [Steinernema carpocapsae]